MSFAAQAHRRLHSLVVALPTADAKASPALDQPAERWPEQLGLRHEAHEPAWEQRDSERPRVEVRPVVGGDDAPTLARDVLDPGRALAEHEAKQGPTEAADDEVDDARARWLGHDEQDTSRSPNATAVGLEVPAPLTTPLPCRPANGHPSRHRGVAGKGENDRRLPRRRLRRGVEHRPYPRPSEPRLRDSEGGPPSLRDPRRRGRRRLRAVLHRRRRQEARRGGSAQEARERRRAPARNRRRPRGRSDRLASPTGAQAEEGRSRQANGLPRDHEGCDPARADRDPRDRHPARRCAGDPPDPRPALRLRGLPGPVEEGHARPLGGPGAVGGNPARGRARARANGLCRRVVLGHRRELRPRCLPGPPRRGRRNAGRAGP